MQRSEVTSRLDRDLLGANFFRLGNQDTQHTGRILGLDLIAIDVPTQRETSAELAIFALDAVKCLSLLLGLVFASSGDGKVAVRFAITKS